MHKIPLWLLSGRAHLKRQVASLVLPDATRLPYREQVLQFVQAQRLEGRKVVLATASDALAAGQIADHLGLFDDRLCTEGGPNLKGAAKLAAIEAYCREHGHGGFSYVGDSRADLPVWRAAQQVYVVAPSRSLSSAIARLGKPTQVLTSRGSRIRPLVKALRPQQWLKNLLIFMPLILRIRFSTWAGY